MICTHNARKYAKKVQKNASQVANNTRNAKRQNIPQPKQTDKTYTVSGD